MCPGKGGKEMAKKKFGLDSIRGASNAVNGSSAIDINNDTQNDTEKNMESTESITNEEIEDKMQVGAGLINQKSIMMQIYNIPRNKLIINPKNPYSLRGIDSLAMSIHAYGMKAPLDVKKLSDGNYMLLGGERRLKAIDVLINAKKTPEWNKYTLIPCVISDPSKIDLPLSSECKELFAIIATNKEARKYNSGDAMEEIKCWEKIIKELRENGMEYLDLKDYMGFDDEIEDDIPQIQIKGRKTMDILEETTDLSRGQLQKFSYVEKNAVPELLDAIKANKVSIAVADKAVKELNAEEQKTLADDILINNATVKSNEIDNYKTTEEERMPLSIEDFDTDITQIKSLFNKDGNVMLTNKEIKEYKKLVKKIGSLFIA